MTLLIVALAVARITRLIVRDTFPPILWAREHLLARWPSEDTSFTEEWIDGETTRYGAPVIRDGDTWYPAEPHWVGDLITCVWCCSAWVSLVATVILWASEAVVMGWVVWWALPFAFSAVAGGYDRFTSD